MNGIIGMNELLLRSNLSPPQRRWALTVRESAQALLALINDILDISKLEAGKVELEAAEFHLGDTVRAVISMLSPIAAGKRLRLDVDIDPAANRIVTGDAVRLRQVLVNLIGNAIKFTETGHVAVRVAQSPSDPTLIGFEVEDTGIGIEETTLRRLFQTFSQADSTISRRFGGSGLGLAICRELADLMHGTLTAQSVAGKGSVFTLTVPFPLAAEGGAAPVIGIPAEPAQPPQPDKPDKPLHILVVDDNQTNQNLVRSLLEDGGHTTDLAANGREAVEAVMRNNYDAVLMDVQMPVMDGVQATRHIRLLPPPACDVPIIALTADALSGAAERYRTVGMDGYLSKPLWPASLFAALQEAIGRGRSAVAKPPPINEPALDSDVVATLRATLRPERFQAFLHETIADLQDYMARLGTCLEQADAAASETTAHTLISIAGNCGGTGLAKLAREIEQACRHRPLAEAEEIFAVMRQYAAATVNELTGLLQPQDRTLPERTLA